MAHQHVKRLHTEHVVLDIGEDTGGLVFYTGPDVCGLEIEIAPCAAPDEKTHTDVDERLLNGTTLYTGVFPPLPSGEYQVCRPERWSGEQVSIVSGRVTEIDWRSSQPSETPDIESRRHALSA